MCIGIPMRVLHIDNGMAECAGQGRSERTEIVEAFIMHGLDVGQFLKGRGRMPDHNR